MTYATIATASTRPTLIDLNSVLVVIPTYNEIDNLDAILDRTLAAVPGVHCLVVDDESPDGTGRKAAERAARDVRIRALHRKGKQGLGTAYMAGFSYGITSGYDVIVEMDADGSHAPEQLPRLLAALSYSDVVLGSRWVAGGEVVAWPRSRQFLSRAGNAYVRRALGVRLHDATGGFRAYRSGALSRLDHGSVASQGYCFQVDLAWRAISAGLVVTEVPITFAERRHGQSKMSSSIVAEALIAVTRWGARKRFGQVRRLVGRSTRKPCGDPQP